MTVFLKCSFLHSSKRRDYFNQKSRSVSAPYLARQCHTEVITRLFEGVTKTLIEKKTPEFIFPNKKRHWIVLIYREKQSARRLTCLVFLSGRGGGVFT